MIQNSEELERIILRVNADIQSVQDFIGSDDPDEYDFRNYKIRFPSNYLRSVAHFKKRLEFIEDETLKRNIAYCLIEADLQSWLLNRTNIIGTLREMILKSGIIKMASIAESCVWYYTKSWYGGNRKYLKRCNSLRTKGIISEDLAERLNWLWNCRDAIHLFLIGEAEYNKYADRDYDKAFLTVGELMDVFNAGK